MCRNASGEIRFNLLAIAQRPLPILTSQLNSLKNLNTTLQAHLTSLTPDWPVLSEDIPATPSQIDSTLFNKVMKTDDTRDLLALKKGLDRDIILIKEKIIAEEERLSEYSVRFAHRLFGDERLIKLVGRSM